MGFKASVLGQVNQRLWSNPVVGTAITAGLGLGAVTGVSSYLTTDGTAGERADAGASSTLKWGAVGMSAVGATAIGLNITGAARAGWERYGQRDGPGGLPSGMHGPEFRYGGFGPKRWGGYNSARTTAESAAYGTARNLRDVMGFGGKAAKSYSESLIEDARHLAKDKNWQKWDPWAKTLSRPVVSGGIGALIGAGVGHHLTGDSRGTAVGAAVGTGVGIAVGRAIKANRVWSKWGAAGKFGVIAAGSIALGAGIAATRGGDYENVDVAESEGSYNTGVSDRMQRMNADGNLVFGLHRRRGGSR